MTELIEAVARAIRDRDAWRTWKGEQAHRESAQAALTAITDAGYRIVPGWQPIETAPKDGTLVLLYLPDGLMACRRWQDNHWRGWDSEDATHWMPLPAAPGDEK
jgi:hypothetical protein